MVNDKSFHVYKDKMRVELLTFELQY